MIEKLKTLPFTELNAIAAFWLRESEILIARKIPNDKNPCMEHYNTVRLAMQEKYHGFTNYGYEMAPPAEIKM